MENDLDPALAWAILGLTLVIIEMFSGSFYLLMLGVAALGAAAAAWFGQDLPVQIMVAVVIAGAGVYLVHAHRLRNAATQMPSVDAGQPATFEAWVDEGARLARVRYRDATWEAVVEGGASPSGGAILYVVESRGNTLKVSARRPG